MGLGLIVNDIRRGLDRCSSTGRSTPVPSSLMPSRSLSRFSALPLPFSDLLSRSLSRRSRRSSRRRRGSGSGPSCRARCRPLRGTRTSRSPRQGPHVGPPLRPVLLIGGACCLFQALVVRRAEGGAGSGEGSFSSGSCTGGNLDQPALHKLPCSLRRRPPHATPCAHAPPARTGPLALGVLLGWSPWWLRILETGFASLEIPGVRPLDGSTLAERWTSLLSEGLPTLLGTAAIDGKPSRGGLRAAVCVAATVFVLGVAAATARSAKPATITGRRRPPP